VSPADRLLQCNEIIRVSGHVKFLEYQL
jgi:hypothetical protein